MKYKIGKIAEKNREFSHNQGYEKEWLERGNIGFIDDGSAESVSDTVNYYKGISEKDKRGKAVLAILNLHGFYETEGKPDFPDNYDLSYQEKAIAAYYGIKESRDIPLSKKLFLQGENTNITSMLFLSRKFYLYGITIGSSIVCEKDLKRAEKDMKQAAEQLGCNEDSLIRNSKIEGR